MCFHFNLFVFQKVQSQTALQAAQNNTKRRIQLETKFDALKIKKFFNLLQNFVKLLKAKFSPRGAHARASSSQIVQLPPAAFSLAPIELSLNYPAE